MVLVDLLTSSSLEIARIPLGECPTVTARTWPRICPPFSRSFGRLRRALATSHLPERGQLGSPAAIARLPGSPCCEPCAAATHSANGDRRGPGDHEFAPTGPA